MDESELPFDQYQRYRLVADVLGVVRTAGERLEVLDVGGRTALLRRFLPEDRVELVDVEPSAEPGLVLGDGSRLPFADAAFDAVVTFDTLEHVPPARRDEFVRECRRVARRWVVIAGPYRTPEVERAERLLREFLATKLRERHRYLEEHHDNGLPEREPVEQLLRALGGRVVSIGHGNLERWLPLMGLELYLDRDAPLRPIARDFFRYYNRVLYASDHATPVYRHAVVAAFGDARLPDPDALLGGARSAGGAPAAASAPIEHLARELLAFDAQRDVVQAEWRRLQAEHLKLEADLAGHRATISALRADLARLKEGAGTLEAELARERREGGLAREVLATDLATHRASLAELRALNEALEAERSRLRSDLEREREEGEAARVALSGDLEGHRSSLAALRAEHGQLEAERGELEAERVRLGRELARERAEQEAAREALQEDLEGHRDALAALREEQRGQLAAFDADRRAHEAAAAGLQEELAVHRAVQAELQAELEAQRAGQRELLADLERMHGVAGSIQRDLLATQAELERERERVAELRTELRSRWKNLRRALAWRKVVP